MRKCDELNRRDSCLNKADEHELMFVLLGRDVAAPAAIRAWILERIAAGKNTVGDAQLVEAEACAKAMEYERLMMKGIPS